MGKIKPKLFDENNIVREFRGKKGKFIGCCPACNLPLADWEITGRAQKYAKCSRCERTNPLTKLKAYESINDGFDAPRQFENQN